MFRYQVITISITLAKFLTSYKDINFDGSNPNLVAMSELWNRMSTGQGKKQSFERKKLPISEARKVIEEVELEKLLEKIKELN